MNSLDALFLCKYTAGRTSHSSGRKLHWLGDYWSWNRNFLEATLVFLLATAALHLPARWAASRGARTLALAAPGLISIGLTVIHLISVRG